MSRCVMLLLAALLSGPAAAQQIRPAPPATAEMQALPGFVPLVQRRFAQLVWNSATGAIDRRTYVVDDPLGGPPTALFWQPAAPETDRPGTINGRGTLVWRDPDLPAAAAGAFIASFTGTLVQGRFQGSGTFVHRSGARYQGEWQDGVMHGAGRLHLPSGDEYQGGFALGRRSGFGQYIDRFGNVFDGAFVAGRRDGPGRFYPVAAPGFTSRWQADRELPGSRAEIAGPAGRAHILPSQYQAWPDAQVAVAVLYNPEAQANPNNAVQYQSAAETETLVVYPGRQELLDAWYGDGNIARRGALAQSYIGNLAAYQPVDFQLSLENRATTPLRVLGAFIDVASSRVERKPVLVVNSAAVYDKCYSSVEELPYCPTGSVDRTLFVSNYGWSAAENVTLSLALAGPDGTALGAPSTLSLAPIADQGQVDLAPFLAGLGLNVDYLETFSFDCSDTQDCLRQARDSGAFGSVAGSLKVADDLFTITLVGSMSYEWIESSGARGQATSRIRIDVAVGAKTVGAEFGEGGEPEPIRTAPFVLDMTQSAYQIAIPLAADVPAGQIGNWSLRLDAPMSSTTEFRLVLQLADGRQIASRLVRFMAFKPRITVTN